MTLQMSTHERDLLLELLDREIADLGPEIHHTRTREYRRDLKADKQTLMQLREKVLAPAEPEPQVRS